MDGVILAFATSGAACSVAVVQGDAVLDVRSFPHEMRLLERLMPAVQDTLKDAGVRLADVALIAADIGPGSFTGMRIGVMTAKCLAWARGIPVVGVSSLEAIAAASVERPVVAVIRARPGTVYWQAFDEGLAAITEPAFAPCHELPMRVGQAMVRDTVQIAHTSDTNVQPILEAASDAAMRIQPREVAPDARTVAHVATLKARRGASGSAMDLVPLYVTEPIIGPPAARG